MLRRPAPLLLLCLLALATASTSTCAREAAGSGDAAESAKTGDPGRTGDAGRAGEAREAAGPAASLHGAASGAVEAKALVPASLSALAEATTADGAVLIQVLEVKHATADTVRVTLAFTSKAAPVAAAADAAADTGTRPLLPADANLGDFCLVTGDGARRLFLLRDAQNQPVIDGSLQPLKPGERRVLQAMFPAPPGPAGAAGQAGRVTLWLGKLPLRNLPVSP